MVHKVVAEPIDRSSMRIMSITPEGLKATGGLGTVMRPLNTAFRAHDVDAGVITPIMGQDHNLDSYHHLGAPLNIVVDGTNFKVSLLAGKLPDSNIPCILIDEPSLFGNRPGVYGEGGKEYTDNWLRSLVMNRAIMEGLRLGQTRADILIAHDWFAALAAPLRLLYEKGGNQGFERLRMQTVLHNILHKGQFPITNFHSLGMPRSMYNQLEYFDTLSTLKAGILYSDVVSTVSENHAKELLTVEGGSGFEGIINNIHRDGRFFGFTNGIETKDWDPRTNTHLHPNFGIEDAWEGKLANRAYLYKTFFPHLTVDPAIPLIGVLGRMDPQKGIGDVIEAIKEVLQDRKGQFVAMGPVAKQYQAEFEELQRLFPDQVGIHDGFINPHLPMAAFTYILVPSKVEPCGLTQQEAMRYGTVPIVAPVGGLVDTVIHGVNGYVLRKANADNVYYGIKIALRQFSQLGGIEEYKRWSTNAMLRDATFDKAIKGYIDVARRMLSGELVNRAMHGNSY